MNQHPIIPRYPKYIGWTKISARDSASRHLNPARRIQIEG